MQWLQDPNKSNVDNLNSVRRETSRHFRNKKKKYLKAKIDELETNSYIKNTRDLYRGINDFNTLRTGSFKSFKRPFPGFLTILTL